MGQSFPCFSNLLPGIGEKRSNKVWFWEFSTHRDIYFVCGKMPEPHFDAWLSPNPGKTIAKRENTSWTQDLRVKRIHQLKVLTVSYWRSVAFSLTNKRYSLKNVMCLLVCYLSWRTGSLTEKPGHTERILIERTVRRSRNSSWESVLQLFVLKTLCLLFLKFSLTCFNIFCQLTGVRSFRLINTVFIISQFSWVCTKYGDLYTTTRQVMHFLFIFIYFLLF